MRSRHPSCSNALAATALAFATSLFAPWVAAPDAAAAVLPEDRADLLYHRYDGGGVVVDGPSVLVRKSFADKVSVVANYYLDMVSSASVDVLSTASPYTDERTQMSLGLDYLRGKTTYSIGYIDSDESDYLAKTAYLGISQDMFGDLTTISIGYRRGMNDVYRNVKDATSGAKSRDPNFHQEMDSRAWTASLTQVLTRQLIGVLSYELVTDEGYLNNPYRQIRYADPTSLRGFSYAPEVYPATKTSSSAAARLKYSLPWWRAAVDGTYRYYNDTWGIRAQTMQIGYTQPAFGNWIFDARYRYYTQDAADFYRDLFPRRDTLNFQGRDKELSTYTAHTVGVGATWEFRMRRLPWLEKGTVNLRYDYMMMSYDDFRDVTAGGLAGAEPLFELDASVIQFFVSAWF
ncbi:MAG: DUF3570 domain-containing protein [Steroidobacteraceae bacterium]